MQDFDKNELIAQLLACGSDDSLNELMAQYKETMNRKEIIKKHMQKFHPKTMEFRTDHYDGRVYTNIELPNGKLKRVKKKTTEELEDYLIGYYRGDFTTTIRDIYEKWISYEIKRSVNNARKIQWTWNKYFEGSSIADVDIKTVSQGELDELFMDLCLNYRKADEKRQKEAALKKGLPTRNIEGRYMTERQAQDAKSVLNLIFDYALANEIIEKNIARNITNATRNKDYLEVPSAKTTEEEVFSDEEIITLMNKALELFKKTKNTIYLGLVLNFHIGLREGELIALQFDDFNLENQILTVSRQEIDNTEVDENGKIHKNGFKISTRLKKGWKSRDITLDADAVRLVSFIREANIQAGFGDVEWLFINSDGERRHKKAIDKALENVCNQAEILHRSNHKIRKTFISNLFRSRQFSLVEIRDQAGHRDGAMTLSVYGHCTTPAAEKARKMDSTFSSPEMKALEEEIGKAVKMA